MKRGWQWSWVLTGPALVVLCLVASDALSRYRLLLDQRDNGLQADEWSFASLATQHAIDAVTARFDGPVPAACAAVRLEIPTRSRDALLANLPDSAFEYRPARLQYPDGAWRDVRVRYRGDSAFHWLYPHKSLRIKTQKTELLDGLRTFNLNVNKGYGETLSNLTGYRLAQRLGLAAPRVAMVRLEVNGRAVGLRLRVEQTNRQFLAHLGLPRGDLYIGDAGSPLEAPLASLADLRDPAPADLPDLFGGAWLWRKRAYGRSAVDDREPMRDLLSRLQDPEARPGERFDLEELGRFSAFVLLAQAHHISRQHNWKLYYDHFTGRFKPVVWDPLAWFRDYLPSDLSDLDPGRVGTLLEARLFAEPVFRRARYDALVSFFAEERASFRRGLIVEADEALHGCDGFAASGYDLRGGRLDTQAIQDGVARFLEQLTAGLDVLENKLFRAEVGVAWQRIDGGIRLRLRGAIPVRSVEVWQGGRARRYPVDLWPTSSPVLPAYPVARAYGTVEWKSAATNDVLLPGLSDQPIERVVVWLRTPFARSVAASPATDLARPEPLPLPVQSESWSGTVEITGHRVVEVPVVISAGTRVHLGPGAVLRFRAKLTASGSAQAPIEIRATDPSKPFGSVAIEGAASGSRLRHVHVDGGGAPGLPLPSGLGPAPRAPGVLNIHGVRDVRLSDVRVSRGGQADDLIHIAHAEVVLERCVLRDHAGDGVDADASQVAITDCLFERLGGDAVDLMATIGRADGNRILGAGDKGYSVGEGSTAFIVGGVIQQAAVGVESRDGSLAWLQGTTVSGTPLGVHATVKSWRYNSGGRVVLTGSSTVDGEQRLGPRSSITLR